MTSTSSASSSETKTERLSAKYPSSAATPTVTSLPTSTLLDISSVSSNERVPCSVVMSVTVAVSGVSAACATEAKAGERGLSAVLVMTANATSLRAIPLSRRRRLTRLILPLIRSIKISFLSFRLFRYVYEKSKAAAGSAPSPPGSPVSSSCSS